MKNWKVVLASILGKAATIGAGCFLSMAIGYMFGSEDMRNHYQAALNEAAEEEDGWNIRNIEAKVDGKDPWKQ